MARLLQPLWLLLAAATDRELATMVEYLKAENRVLRDKLPKRITVTPRERERLVKLGRPLGAKLKDLVTIVSPTTFARWLRGAARSSKPADTGRTPGRPRTPDDIRAQIVRLARETGWGYCRILGELRKLGIRSVSRSTVVNILKEGGLDPSPERAKGTWADFLKRHAATLWASDFVGVKTWTTSGLVDVYVLVFMHVGSRRVFISGMTAAPDSAWVTQQARNVSMTAAEWGVGMTHLVIDHDTKFTKAFDAVLTAVDVSVHRVGPRAPNLNAHVERFI